MKRQKSKISLAYLNVLLFFFFIIYLSACKDTSTILDNSINDNKPVKSGNNKITTTYANTIILATIQDWEIWGRDRMLSNGYDENPTDGISLGQCAYILGETPSIGTVRNLYRFWNSSIPDHMTSWNINEVSPPQWIYESQIGQIWKENLFPAQTGYGLKKFYRYYNLTNGDHLSGFISPIPSDNYTNEGEYGWAFERYGNQREVLEEITTTGPSLNTVSLKCNKVFGGTIWELSWNNKQFVNHWNADPCGRTITFCMVRNNDVNNYVMETGQSGMNLDGSYIPVRPTEWINGSPLTHFTKTGQTIYTKVKPLLFDPNSAVAPLDYKTHPAMYTGSFEKQVQLNKFFGGTNSCYSGIIELKMTINMPSSEEINQIELAGAHLTNEFKKFYTYDASSSTNQPVLRSIPEGAIWSVHEQLSSSGQGAHKELWIKDGGVIIATNDDNYALGCYWRGDLNYEWEGFQLVNFTDGSTAGSNDYQVAKFALIKLPYKVKNRNISGSFSFTTYLVVGTKTDVKRSMDYLHTKYQNGDLIYQNDPY